uniref:RTC domain-containing protein n=1 Tax=Macrostomum lignano TaxID=282301 RepID=A0A1I8JQ77_9PLAT
FRSRIALSILTGKPVKISSIRAKLENPGVREFEISYLRLIEQITNGTVVRISETGTVCAGQAGYTYWAASSNSNCCAERGIGYYLSRSCCLARFGKRSLSVKLTGVSNNSMDPSVEAVSYSCLPLLRRFFGRDSGSELSLERRVAIVAIGVGGAEVRFQCPTVSKLKPLVRPDTAPAKSIASAHVFTCKVSPGMNGRQIVSAKGAASPTGARPDTLHRRQGRQSPRFGVTLVAETRDGCRYVAEFAPPRGGRDGAGRAAEAWCREGIYRGGCVDSISQPLALALMAPVSALLRLLRASFLASRFDCNRADRLGGRLAATKCCCAPALVSRFANLSKLK